MEITLRENPSRWITPLICFCFLPYNAFGHPDDDYYIALEMNVVVMIAITTFIFLTFYCVTCMSRSCRDHNGSVVPPLTTATTTSSDHVGGGDDGVTVMVMMMGLDARTIECFPSFRYAEVKGFKLRNGELECAVCLGEFEDDEILRLMWPCSHVFHVCCIDPWLLSRSTCPVCRVQVVPVLPELFSQRVVECSGTGLGDEETRDLESCNRYLLGHDESWTDYEDEDKPTRTRSCSVGHLMVRSDENLDRFTLRLPEEVRRQLTKTYTVKWSRHKATILEA